MKPILTLLLTLTMTFAAHAQSGALSGKVAVTSLIGNQITVDTYRRRVGTSVNTNHQEVIPVPTPVFDNTAISAAANALYPQLTPGSTVATLAVPAPDSDFDPARLVVDGAVPGSNALVAALKANGFTHVLAIAKHRGLARLQLSGATVGSGQLQGLGFYIDNDLGTQRLDTLESGRGFIAPYAYIRLNLIDLNTLQILGERIIAASATRSAARNETGFSPWGAMTPEEKFSMLDALLKKHIAQEVPALFQKK